MIKCLAYVKKESKLQLWVQTVQKMKTRKPQRANATLCSQPPKLCLEVIGPRFSHIEEQNRNCIHWWSALCGDIVFYPFHLYIVRKLSVIYYFSFSFFSCLKFPFVVFHSFLADISHLCVCKDWSSAVLRKSEVMRAKFLQQQGRNFGSKNSGFENSFKNRLFYLQRIHDVMAVISRQHYAN